MSALVCRPAEAEDAIVRLVVEKTRAAFELKRDAAVGSDPDRVVTCCGRMDVRRGARVD